jgi:glyoxylase-like metal-dependent hydrolase (beta-lactamase superfamily II)
VPKDGARVVALGVAGAPAPGRLTTTFVLDGGVVVDTGAAAHGLSPAERATVSDFLLTHAHLDHTLGIPFLLGEVRPTIHGLRQTLGAVRGHLLDGHIWPDLSDLATWREVAPGERFPLKGWEVEVGPANHTVPCVSYLCRKPGYAVALVGDTRFDDSVARWVADRSPDACVVEVSFPDDVAAMASRFGHQTPRDLRPWRGALGPSCELLVTHMKPQHEALIRAACAALKDPRLRILDDGDVLHA